MLSTSESLANLDNRSYQERFRDFRSTLSQALKRETNLQELYEKLFSLKNPNVSLTLKRMNSLAKALRNPQESYPVILVTGTNGKGTTTTLIAKIMSSLGLRVGLFRKPHLVDYRERYAIFTYDKEEYISEDELLDTMDQVVSASSEVEEELGELPSFFEISVGIAYQWFKQREVDLAVVEIGLGGRLDATNIVSRPLVSVLTNVYLEHVKTLGNSVESIAREKSFIGRWKRPFVTQASGKALEVLERIADERGYDLMEVGDLITYEITRDSLSGVSSKILPSSPPSSSPPYLRKALSYLAPVEVNTSTPGSFLFRNIPTSVVTSAIASYLLGLKLTPDNLRAIERFRIPGRMTVINYKSSLKIILDSAKDIGALHNLAQWLREKNLTPVILFTLSKGKNLDEIASILRGFHLIVTSHSNRARAMEVDQLQRELKLRGVNVIFSAPLSQAWEFFLEKLPEYGIGLVTGSLYLVGDAFRLLGIDPMNLRPER